jgi:hypothetical protein
VLKHHTPLFLKRYEKIIGKESFKGENMKFVNESGLDRMTRMMLAMVLFSFGISGIVPQWLGIIVMGMGIIPLFTGMLGFCPIYQFVGVRTNKS